MAGDFVVVTEKRRSINAPRIYPRIVENEITYINRIDAIGDFLSTELLFLAVLPVDEHRHGFTITNEYIRVVLEGTVGTRIESRSHQDLK